MSSDSHRLAVFTAAYIECALWSSTDESRDDGGDPLDQNYSSDDLSNSALDVIRTDCRAFLEANAEDIGSKVERAGHDFWLNRNGHGAGFWDGDWPEPAASRLDTASKAFGSCDLYVGDDGLLYV